VSAIGKSFHTDLARALTHGASSDFIRSVRDRSTNKMLCPTRGDEMRDARSFWSLTLLALLVCLFVSADRVGHRHRSDYFDGSSHSGTTVTTPSFATNSGNQLLLAFISADNVTTTKTTVTNVTGGGLTWVLVRRTNAR
jgi:hypothetical protein